MTKDDYTVELATLWTLAHAIEAAPIEEMLQDARVAEATAPIVAPSLWALGSQALARDIVLMEAMLAVKRIALAAKGGDAR